MKSQAETIRNQQWIIASLLQITLNVTERFNIVCEQNKHLAKSLHKEIDYSEKLQKKIDNLKQRIKK